MNQNQSLIVLSVLFVFGCASNAVYNNTNLYDEKSQNEILIIRPDNRVGSMVSNNIYLNSVLIGKLKTKSYLSYKVHSGKFQIKIGEGDSSTLFIPQSINFEVVNGKSSCFLLEDDFINDQRGSHISLKPKELGPEDCENQMKIFAKAISQVK